MQESLHDYMKVGLVHFMAFPECMGGDGPLLESLDLVLHDPFFEVLEVTRINDANTRKIFVERAEQGRLELAFAAQPIILGGGLNLNHEDEAERTKAVHALEEALDMAHEMRMTSMALLSGKVDPDKDSAMQRLADSLNLICTRGEELGIRLVIETFDQVPFGKNCLIGPTPDAVALTEQITQTHSNFGLMLDLSHLPLLGEDSGEAIACAGKHLVHAHIGNCAMDNPSHPAYGDNHPRFGAPGTRNDVPELSVFLRALLEAGYLSKEKRNTVSFEVKPMAGEDPVDIINGSKRALIEAWRSV